MRFSIKIDEIPEDLEIVSMSLSNSETKLAVALGQVVQGIDETIHQIVVFELSVKLEEDSS